MTVPEKLTALAHKAGMPLTCKRADENCYSRYVFILDDGGKCHGKEYASAESYKDGCSELVRFLRLYGPTLTGPGFANLESVQTYLSACAVPELASIVYER